MQYFPLFVSGERLRVLLVGGGVIAAAKLETLAASGARISIVALSFSDGVRRLAEQYTFSLIEQAYDASLLTNCNVVVAATGDAQLGAQIAKDAASAGIWANIVDDPDKCDFIFPAIIRHGPLQIAISSSGVSPVLARLLKQEIEQIIPEHVELLLDFMQSRTATVRKNLPDVLKRRIFWERCLRGPIGQMLADGGIDQAEAWFAAALASTRDSVAPASLHSIVLSSYAPDDLTVRAVRCIGKADIVYYAGGRALFPILDRYARRDAEKIAIDGGGMTAQAIAPLMQQGGVIVYLARGEDEVRQRIEAGAEEAGIPVARLTM